MAAKVKKKKVVCNLLPGFLILLLMKIKASLIACILIISIAAIYRFQHLPDQREDLKVTTWDALGYYSYAPAFIIYKEHKKLDWLSKMEEKYSLSAGDFYQAQKCRNNNNRVFKYLGGVSMMQLPFFLLAHYAAPGLGYLQDGYSAPYQYAMVLAALFYAFLGLIVLRIVLGYFFDDFVVTTVLLLVALATNFMQYVAIDSAMSHVYIFPLYALILLATIRWHKNPSVFWAIAIGYIIGLATICRPTEAIMLFIPLFWDTTTKEMAKNKWQLVKRNRSHIVYAALGGLLGILPQLLYWKSVTGSWIYDVGSAWDFLTPHFRVLFGPEKGWFIYTPVTILFVAGMFLMKGRNFKKSVLWFCLLNIYIIISWRDWQYGGAYSTRALVQSYPVFALAIGSFIHHIKEKKIRWLFYTVAIYLVVVNFFQLQQYNAGILHHRDMNWRYYGAIYLNPSPTSAEVSLMDTKELLSNKSGYKSVTIASIDSTLDIQFPHHGSKTIFTTDINKPKGAEAWLVIKATIDPYDGFWGGRLQTMLHYNDTSKVSSIRLYSPLGRPRQWNNYEMHMRVPDNFKTGELSIQLNRDNGHFIGKLKDFSVELYSRP